MTICRSIVLVCGLVLSLACCSCSKPAAVKVDEAQTKRRCAKWGKLLRMAQEPLDKCVEGMKKLAARAPAKFACGNACIDGAEDARALVRCMADCKEGKRGPKP